MYGENDSDVMGPDGSRRSSDLYSPELNLEAHRTAQEVDIYIVNLIVFECVHWYIVFLQQVYNSLQDPPSSPLLLKGHSQDTCTYITDPSFTRTSEVRKNINCN